MRFSVSYMSRILNCYKELGETPKERLERLRREQPEFRESSLTFLGRLDPLAEGVMLVGVDLNQRQREHYLARAKEYRLTILFGFATDTYDVLGKLTEAVTRQEHPRVQLAPLLGALAKIPGRRTQLYPAYSSKPAEHQSGARKPLHAWAREGVLADVEMPSREIEIYDCSLLGLQQLTQEELQRGVRRQIHSVTGDFRQSEIFACWVEHLSLLYGKTFDLITLHISASSGTYVRALAHELGVLQGIPAVAYHILRTKVGEYGIETALR